MDTKVSLKLPPPGTAAVERLSLKFLWTGPFMDVNPEDAIPAIRTQPHGLAILTVGGIL